MFCVGCGTSQGTISCDDGRWWTYIPHKSTSSGGEARRKETERSRTCETSCRLSGISRKERTRAFGKGEGISSSISCAKSCVGY